jgi:hypothetical protein
MKNDSNAENAANDTATPCCQETCVPSVILRARWNKKIQVRVLDDNITMRTGAGAMKHRGVLYERLDTPEGLTARKHAEFYRLFCVD